MTLGRCDWAHTPSWPRQVVIFAFYNNLSSITVQRVDDLNIAIGNIDYLSSLRRKYNEAAYCCLQDDHLASDGVRGAGSKRRLAGPVTVLLPISIRRR